MAKKDASKVKKDEVKNTNNQQVVSGESADVVVNGVEGRDTTPAGTTAEANAETSAAERIQPPVAANGVSPEASDEAYVANTQVNPAMTATEVKEHEDKESAEKNETRKNEAKVVETELGTSEEEAAAERAGVYAERLNNPRQNREPKNEFEKSNQKVTEEERQAAQEVSDMTTKEREDKAPTPQEAAKTDAARTAEVNQSNDVAKAIQNLADSNKKDSFKLEADAGVEARYTLVQNKDGEVMIRENETGHLSKLQLESIEEKEASVQSQEVTEL